jgi:hypothetical protein
MWTNILRNIKNFFDSLFDSLAFIFRIWCIKFILFIRFYIILFIKIIIYIGFKIKKLFNILRYSILELSGSKFFLVLLVVYIWLQFS